MSSIQITTEVIEKFLGGNDPQKYIVAVEATYHKPNVTLVINDPEKGKYLEEHPFKPFLWFKEDVKNILYGGKRLKIIEACTKYDIKITALRVADDNGKIPKKLEEGYKFMATCKKSYNDLLNFFKEGGMDVWNKEFSKMFMMFSPAEQFMIQSGKRLYKGMDDYDDIHRLQFDLETEGLFASKHTIFQIGIRDNRGFETILEVTGNTYQEKRDSERLNLQKFFKIIDMLKPDVITGYNSEAFDWQFISDRCEKLGISIGDLSITLDPNSKLKRKDGMIKLGGESEPYKQTSMYGYNIIDICHSVRRAMAINSDIQFWNLKYITQYSEIAKPNRVYIKGDEIYKTWNDVANEYAFNEVNGKWYIISKEKPLKEGYQIVTGSFIVRRYLLDDLWETEKIDIIFNQATFLIAKMLPTTYQRASTMGTSGQWKLIMSAWSYENGLAIPSTEPKRDFTGGLSRLLEVGYSPNVVKLDYAALYPKTELTHDIFPELDITGAMKGLLTYVVDTRDKNKFLMDKHKKLVKKLKADLEKNSSTYSAEKIAEIKKEIEENKTLQNLYDKKQLPLKILANSWFGSYGAPYIFNWGETNYAEETTCRGRQYLRLMVKHFTEKHGFRPLVGDSVTYDTPVYIKTNLGNIDIIPICDVFNEHSSNFDDEKLRDYESKPYQILTINGWRNIKYVYKHATTKVIHRITTKDRLVNVTEDHSLFQDNVQIKPSSLMRGDKIDVTDIAKFNSIDKIPIDLAWLYGFFLGDGSSNSGDRIQYYTSRKTGVTKANKGKRSDWKISNSNLNHLKKLNNILEIYGFTGVIKDHRKSSSVYNLIVHDTSFARYFSDDFYTSYREKKIPICILNATEDIKKSFLEGVCASDGYGDTLDTCSDIGMKSQVAMAGIAYLMNELGIEYKIKTRKDKPNFISFSLKNSNRNNSSFTDKTQKKTNEVWKNEIILNKNGFVYDISTDDGTFIGGIGAINLKNTDGFNFAFPTNVNDFKYIAKGSHWKTSHNANVELSGLEAVLAEFNETYMIGRMGLDIDDICTSTINFSRKNYANLIDGKVKLVGNSIKSKKMATYIEDFLKVGIRMLLEGKGYEFIEYYYEYVNKIYNYNIPLVKIASKSKVKTTMTDYKKKANQKNKAGKPMPKQAHMELALRDGLDVNYGDVIYYVNTGKAKSHGDLKSITNADGSKEIQLNCKLINTAMVESGNELIKEMEDLKKQLLDQKNPVSDVDRLLFENRIEEIEDSLETDEYNVARYLAAFNKKLEPLMVCFHPDIRGKILSKIKKVKKVKGQTEAAVEKLEERSVFTRAQCELVSGMPIIEGSQDDYEKDLMTMEDKEIKFWINVNMVPNNITEEDWIIVKEDYIERLRIAKENGIIQEKENLEDIFKRLEISEIIDIKDKGLLPLQVFEIADVDSKGFLISRKWEEPLCDILDIFKYESIAIERNEYYQINGIVGEKDRFEKWVDYKAEQIRLTGGTIDIPQINVTQEEMFPVEQKKVKKIDDEDNDEDDDEDDEENNNKEEIDDFAPELQLNAYLQDGGAVHVENRPNIKVYPTHTPIVQPTIKVEVNTKEEDEWGF